MRIRIRINECSIFNLLICRTYICNLHRNCLLSKAKDTGDFYVAGKGFIQRSNGMATGDDDVIASFISIAGIIAFSGRDGAVYLMGWTGGYVLLALLLAPYLRKFEKYTVPEFIGTRYYSDLARIVAVFCLIFISFTPYCWSNEEMECFSRFLR